MSIELTLSQKERQQKVDYLCYRLLCDLAGQELAWNEGHISEIIEVAQYIICERLGIMTAQEFYPYADSD